jgi:hypothetical protein
MTSDRPIDQESVAWRTLMQAALEETGHAAVEKLKKMVDKNRRVAHGERKSRRREQVFGPPVALQALGNLRSARQHHRIMGALDAAGRLELGSAVCRLPFRVVP